MAPLQHVSTGHPGYLRTFMQKLETINSKTLGRAGTFHLPIISAARTTITTSLQILPAEGEALEKNQMAMPTWNGWCRAKRSGTGKDDP